MRIVPSNLFLYFCSAILASAQVPIIPSVTVENTRVPVFAEMKPSSEPQTVEHPKPVANFRLHLEYRLPTAKSSLAVRLANPPEQVFQLPNANQGKWQTLDLQYEQPSGKPAVFWASVDGKAVVNEQSLAGAKAAADGTELSEKFRLGGDFTALVRFSTRGDGSLFSVCNPKKWSPDAKMLGLRDGKLFYDIGWLGELNGRQAGLSDGKTHTAVVRCKDGKAMLFVDGKRDGNKPGQTRPDKAEHKLHIGKGAEEFDGDLQDGSVEQLQYWERALTDDEAMKLTKSPAGAAAVNTPLLNWTAPPTTSTFPGGVPGLPTHLALKSSGGAEIRDAWLQPLAETAHADIISRWSEESLAEGGKIYNQLCITCHGNLTQEGSMPTSRRFQREAFKNGSDPFRQFQTLTNGYGLMMPLPMYSAEQKYALIHYIRETFLAPKNPQELSKVDASYLASLPLAMKTQPKPSATDGSKDDGNQYEKMDFGPQLTWTYEAEPGNFAYKGVATRLDPGPGGVSKGKTWAIFDHDTMRMAAATAGSFIDWKGVAFDGSHNSHTTLTGQIQFSNPVGPGWAHPKTGSWEDTRFRGRDDKPYGPLPADWAAYHGWYLQGNQVVQSYRIGQAEILEASESIEYGQSPLFLRSLNIGKSPHSLKLRVAAAAPGLTVQVLSPTLKCEEVEGFHVITIPADATPINFRIGLTRGLDAASTQALLPQAKLPEDLSTLTHGGPPSWNTDVTTEGVSGTDEGPFATDIITHPESALNPWQSWMRLGGFDFFADGERAAVCTWLGDVWTVSGLTQQPLGKLTWRRIATGLFQPLGLKIVKETIYVTCRDQLAKLQDLNADGEIDFVQCFNNDHQVTEHFHEFAMGLQTDAAGNFYYAKSARHALPALVAQHGTLLKVSADGSHTDILATGFRAANGVCLNPDGTFFITDQEGHWMPKNRINLVQGNGPEEFFGNMFGYHSITDSSDAAMKPPLCWITNLFDRSPSELVWVPKNAQWGSLNGSLLNLSYGYGKIFTVPYEPGLAGKAPQGGVSPLSMPQFPTGVMRGRFHPKDGQLYACGLFAWAGNQSQPGGFYRVRATGKPALQPIGLHFEKSHIKVTFSDPLPGPETASETARYTVKIWGLKRTANYGSEHLAEHELPVTAASLEKNNDNVLQLTVPELQPTMGLEINCRIKQADGTETQRVIHGTIHQL